MINLTAHIEYLILRHDCVVIPGIGALIALHTPAWIDAELGCMFPPKRSISFNPAIVHNDGLLAHSIARKEAVTYEAAIDILNEQLRELQDAVSTQGEVALGRLGVLRRNDEMPASYLFEAFDSTNTAPGLTGLTAIGIRPLAELSAVTGEINQPKSDKLYYVPVNRNLVRIAASIVMFLMLGFVLTTPIIDDNASKASMGISFDGQQSYAYSPVIDSNPDIDLNIAFPDPEEACAEANPSTSDSDHSSRYDIAVRLMPDDEYFLVVASLPSMEKAEEYVSDNNATVNLGILESAGRYRVYVASGRTYSEANSFNRSGRYPDAWVCKR